MYKLPSSHRLRNQLNQAKIVLIFVKFVWKLPVARWHDSEWFQEVKQVLKKQLTSGKSMKLDGSKKSIENKILKTHFCYSHRFLCTQFRVKHHEQNP
jgi:hypothetical protein